MTYPKSIRFYLATATTNIILFSALYISLPEIREGWVQEGSLLENLTAFLSFVSFIVGLFFVLKIKNKIHQRIYLMLPIMGLIVFLDELSFGENIFDFNFLTIGGMEIDSLHDFISLFFKKFILVDNSAGYGLHLALIVIAFALAVLIAFIYHKFYSHKSGSYPNIDLKKFSRDNKSLAFLGIAALLGLLAMTVDLRILQFRGAKFLEELFEMNAAFALLMACFSINAQFSTVSSPTDGQ